MKNNLTRITKKGQVVLRKEIRDMLNLKPGQIIEERICGKEIILRPLPTLIETGGILKKMAEKSTLELIKEIDEGWK